MSSSDGIFFENHTFTVKPNDHHLWTTYLKSAVISNFTRRTVLVMGCKEASNSTKGNSKAHFFTKGPIFACLSIIPRPKQDKIEYNTFLVKPSITTKPDLDTNASELLKLTYFFGIHLPKVINGQIPLFQFVDYFVSQSRKLAQRRLPAPLLMLHHQSQLLQAAGQKWIVWAESYFEQGSYDSNGILESGRTAGQKKGDSKFSKKKMLFKSIQSPSFAVKCFLFKWQIKVTCVM